MISMYSLEILDFFLSCVYGDHVMENKPAVWERISRTGIHRKESWCMLGDFNDLIYNGEKIGGLRRCDFSFLPFNDMLRASYMVELPSTGNHFTLEVGDIRNGFNVGWTGVLVIMLCLSCVR